MQALMQDWSLTLDKILDHAARWHGEREIVTRTATEAITRITYTGLRRRAKMASSALLADAVKPGDRIATLAWNSDRHVELWYGVIGIGAVLHTVNPRLFPEQIAYIINHAEDEILFADPSCAGLVEQILPSCPKLRRVIFLSDAASKPETSFASCDYEGWIDGQADDVAWGGFDETMAAGLCYTSGTTGNPKGVLYGHRSNYLHAMMTLQPDVLNLSAQDSILLLVPMYHANAWGVMYSAPMVGAKLVLPGQKLDAESICDLIESEGVTYAAAVPTVWQMVIDYLKATGRKFSTLRRVTVGGAACPESIIRTLGDDYGVRVIQGWGMTETSPCVTTAAPLAPPVSGKDVTTPGYLRTQGRVACNLDLKIVSDAGERLPHDAATMGRLMVKGPTVARRYFRDNSDKTDPEGFFDTGDIAHIDPGGYVQIVDRAKDVIKSGGEWISSVDVENIAVDHPKAEMCAVIGVPHPKWSERPLLIVQLRAGATAEKREFLEFLGGKIARWWMPDDVLFVDRIPLGPTGKVDKKGIREELATRGYSLPLAGMSNASGHGVDE